MRLTPYFATLICMTDKPTKSKIPKAINKIESKPLRRLAIDILGVLLIITAGAIGWLPGPGGIPLFLAGLGLLAKNHTWAQNLLNILQKHGNKLSALIFRNHRWLIITYDVFAAVILLAAGLILGKASGNIVRGLSIVLIFFGLTLFLGNKQRLQRLNQIVRHIKPPNKP